MKTEVERKFLIKQRPLKSEVTHISSASIMTYYLEIGEREERIREVFGGTSYKYFHTVKHGFGLERKEEEREITSTEFYSLKSDASTKPIRKVRYTFIDNATQAKCELDIYLHNGLFPETVEVEFTSVEEAEAFIPPHWFGDDVTEDKQYKNQSLYKKLNNL